MTFRFNLKAICYLQHSIIGSHFCCSNASRLSRWPRNQISESMVDLCRQFVRHLADPQREGQSLTMATSPFLPYWLGLIHYSSGELQSPFSSLKPAPPRRSHQSSYQDLPVFAHPCSALGDWAPTGSEEWVTRGGPPLPPGLHGV